MADIPAVLDTVGSDRPAVIANIGGGILAIPFAAAHPERISSLILVDCFARFLEAPGFPAGAPLAELAPALELAEGDTGRGVMVDLFAPSRRERRAGPARLGALRARGGDARQHEGDRPPDLRERRSRPAARHPRPDARDPPPRCRRVRRRARPLPRRAHPRRPVGRAARDRQPHLGRRPRRDGRRDPGVRDRHPARDRAAASAGDGPVHRHRRLDGARGRAGRRPLAGPAGRPQPGRATAARPVRRARDQGHRRRVPGHVRRPGQGGQMRPRDPRRACGSWGSRSEPGSTSERSRSCRTTLPGWLSTSGRGCPRSRHPARSSCRAP